MQKTPQNNGPSVSNGSNNVQGPYQADIDGQEPEKPIEANIDLQTPAAGYNPPGIDGLLGAIEDSDIAVDGRITITADIKREFNQDYRFFFMPQVTW